MMSEGDFRKVAVAPMNLPREKMSFTELMLPRALAWLPFQRGYPPKLLTSGFPCKPSKTLPAAYMPQGPPCYPGCE